MYTHIKLNPYNVALSFPLARENCVRVYYWRIITHHADCLDHQLLAIRPAHTRLEPKIKVI